MTESQDNTINANLTPLPDKVGVDGLEDKWRGVWDESGVYKFQGTRDRKAVYSIDTPPPTVSGHLHVGHVFSYTHTDVIARFKRMNGYDVFYPMGWDDNGLPTERRVQNYYGVRVDTSLKYDPNFVPPFEGTDGKKIDAKDQVPISRKNFIELCEKCPNFGCSWGCPPFDFDTDEFLRQYKYAHLMATKIIPDRNDIPVEMTQEFIRPERVRIEKELLEMERKYGGRGFAYVGKCLYCSGSECTRKRNRPCLHPDKVRPSLEAFGFDIGRTLSELFGIRLLWGKDGILPEYLMLVSGLFHNSVAYWQR